MFSRLFHRPWVFVTLLVFIAVGVMIRLGIWQLDRLEQRRMFNSQVLSQINEPPLFLDNDVVTGNLESYEFRTVQAQGQYDYENNLVLGNQVWDEQIGVHLVTPMVLSGAEKVILVDRGWISFGDWEKRNLHDYDESDSVQVEGMLRVTQTKLGLRDCLDETAGDPPFQVWCLALDEIAAYLPYDLLPVYLIQAPVDPQTSPPYRAIPEIEITEGPHLSYAIQWFTFSAILLIGYPFFVRREMQAREKKKQKESEDLEYHGWAKYLDEENEE